MKETIDLCFMHLDTDTLQQCASFIKNADRVFIFASGDSKIRAHSFQIKLSKINKYITIISELTEWAYHTANMQKSDFALFLTYHGLSEEYIKAAQSLFNRNVPFGVITSASKSKLINLGTLTIQLPNLEEKFNKISTFSSQVAFEFILNVLYSYYYQLDYEKNFDSLNNTLDTFKTIECEYHNIPKNFTTDNKQNSDK